MWNRRAVILAGASAAALVGCGGSKDPAVGPWATQLNWFHDPTFVAHYRLAQTNQMYQAREGGPNVFPLPTLASGLSSGAVCGIDIFLKHLSEQLAAGKTPALKAIFCDFQRNPVGWVLHPDAGAKLGVNPADRAGTRTKVVELVRSGQLRVGDKVGTETTAILRAWRTKINAPKALIMPVGFDASVVLSAPPLLFPVYLNEEPFRLEQQIGRRLIVIDPVDDGVALYGNVVIARSDDPRNHGYVNGLRAAWEWAAVNIRDAAILVGGFYKAVPVPIIEKQLALTVSFARQGGALGSFDLSAGGRLEQSIQMLKEGGTLPRQELASDLNKFFMGSGS